MGTLWLKELEFLGWGIFGMTGLMELGFFLWGMSGEPGAEADRIGVPQVGHIWGEWSVELGFPGCARLGIIMLREVGLRECWGFSGQSTWGSSGRDLRSFRLKELEG